MFSLTFLFLSFWEGLLTPLGAVCVLPLYPGFLSFLASKVKKDDKRILILMGVLVAVGAIVFMLLLGLIFTTLLQQSLTRVVEVVSPIAFVILALISLTLIFNIDYSKYLPKAKTPRVKNPILSAIVFGFFFGAIVIPCNPAFIALFLTRTATVGGFLNGMLNFLAFGIGISFPLLLFSLISSKWSKSIIGFLTAQRKKINLFAGLIMLGISLYYLIFVFKLHTILY